MMKSLIGGLLLASVLLLGASKDAKDQGWKPTPLMRSVTPDTAKIGDDITVAGEYLDKARVSAVYLTDGKSEIKMTIVTQSETAIQVKIPDKVKPGRMRLMVLTTGAEPQFLEQPVSISIE
jgi:hypothetical protein